MIVLKPKASTQTTRLLYHLMVSEMIVLKPKASTQTTRLLYHLMVSEMILNDCVKAKG